MLSKIKQQIYRPIGVCKTLLRVRSRSSRNRNRLFLLNIPSHGNLGDHLLSVAEQRFLADNFPEREVVLVSSADLYYSIRVALMDVREDDVLCVTGGGFLGSMYDEEKRILTIIERYPDNKIVLFPQTIYYAPTSLGEEQVKKASEVYSAHKRLYVMARDIATYDLLRTRLMPEAADRVFLTPDMALYTHFPQDNPRSGVLWCLRKDAEINERNIPVVRRMKRIISEKHLKENDTDTYVSRPISTEAEGKEVALKVDEISKAGLVITDRLHGMIYSIITDTPVIALDNISKKVSQVYDLWLKDIPFVKVVDDTSDLDAVVASMLRLSDCHYDNLMMRKKYQPIIDALNE